MEGTGKYSYDKPKGSGYAVDEKRDDTYYGYKDHVKVDPKSKIIVSYETTSPNVHDSKVILSLLDCKNRRIVPIL